MNNCVDVKLGNCFEYALVYNQIDSPQLYLYVYIQYASKKTSHKRTVQAPCTPRSAPVQVPFAIIGSPVRVFVRFARFFALLNF